MTAQDLEDLLAFHEAGRGHQDFESKEGGLVRAILDVAKQLQPDLVFRTGMVDGQGYSITPATWLEAIGETEIWLDQLGRAPQFAVGAQSPNLPWSTVVRLRVTASTAWQRPTDGPLREFRFIADPRLRAMAERDHTSAVDAQRIADHLVTAVMVGSVVEAMLLDLLVRNGDALTSIANLSLETLIKRAKPYFRFPHTAPDVERIRDHRNRVHPGKVLQRELPPPTTADAMVALGFLQRLVEDLTPP